MKKLLFTAIITLSLITTVGCLPQKKKDVQVKTSEITEESKEKNIYGSYQGTFPCADCGGKDIDLTLSEDGTYCLRYKYQDKGEGWIEENGTYAIHDDELVETITPSSGEKTFYKFMNGNLVLSDSLGIVNDGELAEFYVLKK